MRPWGPQGLDARDSWGGRREEATWLQGQSPVWELGPH